MDVQVVISVYAIIVIDDQVLLTQDENKSGYKLPGGGVEFNESMIDALKREVKEELNLDVTPKSIIDFHEYMNKKGVHRIRLYFEAQKESGDILLNQGEVASYKLVKIRDLHNYSKDLFF